MSRRKLEEGKDRIERCRREVETRLAAVRRAVADETGRSIDGRGWLTALVAGTVGLAVALRGRVRKQGRLAAGDE